MLRSWDFLDHGDERIKPILCNPEQGPVNSEQLTVNSSLRVDKQSQMCDSTDKNCSRFTGYCSLKRKVAFTLAEVLITLGIIGVVAALTLPTLMNKINNSEKTAKLKKFYSVMTQAYTMAEQEFGSGADWEKVDALRDGDNKLIDQPDAALVFFKKYFAPYLKITDMGVKDLYYNGVLVNKAYAAFADGSMVYLTNGDCIDFIYDVNGVSVPNKLGYDQFDFLYCNKKKSNSYFANENRYFGTFRQKYTEQGRDYNKENCAANGIYCTTLLLIDNWEFKDDYPWK